MKLDLLFLNIIILKCLQTTEISVVKWYLCICIREHFRVITWVHYCTWYLIPVSQTCPEASPVSSWFASGNCCAESWTITLFSIHIHSGGVFFPLCLHSSFLSIWPVPLPFLLRCPLPAWCFHSWCSLAIVLWVLPTGFNLVSSVQRIYFFMASELFKCY